MQSDQNTVTDYVVCSNTYFVCAGIIVIMQTGIRLVKKVNTIEGGATGFQQ